MIGVRPAMTDTRDTPEAALKRAMYAASVRGPTTNASAEVALASLTHDGWTLVPVCGEPVDLYEVPGGPFEPCVKPRAHDGPHDPSWSGDVIARGIELARQQAAEIARLRDALWALGNFTADKDAESIRRFACAALALQEAIVHRCNCPESGTSGSCPFHDNSTIASSKEE
jgi:hypothetical protein